MVLIQAEFAAFREAERDFERALQRLETVLDNLEGDLEQSLAEWDGDARRAYAKARDRWDKSARDLHAELARLHRAIARAHLNFRSSSSTNVRMWSG
ncbi:WXG100 family type VII secretion target [Actinomadura barringtoniae]|uniref:ESAT-6-like protein n=1 Tax=Actinomadura barringtoniae TaxID=1427535 RepID=A0A939T5P6_9ACTN|nr:WXG100 family type VII secretion target [Actinomadura barringtoniae]MBO2447352.1 WXG100 family type VII secretion target [Actinomadura barringtoniae]